MKNSNVAKGVWMVSVVKKRKLKKRKGRGTQLSGQKKKKKQKGTPSLVCEKTIESEYPPGKKD